MSSGLAKIQAMEALATLLLSWKEDLDKNETINRSGSLKQLHEIMEIQPTAHQFSVGTYVCMVAEILMREVRPECAAQILQDTKALGTFMSNMLKIQKSHVPRVVANALAKLTKDSHGQCGRYDHVTCFIFYHLYYIYIYLYL